MSSTLPATGRQLRSLVTADATLVLSLVDVEVGSPAANEIVVRIEAAPINPSDLGLLLGGADVGTAKLSGTDDRPVVSATVPSASMRALGGRIGQSLPVGNEGAGVVVAAGSSDAAQALIGKVVAVLGGAMYTDYRTVNVSQALLLPDGTTARDGASCFVNPLTSLGMVTTMRLEGHSALVHTAAASNLGQMLQKLCQADGIELVNIVRTPEQVRLLRGIGATRVVDSSSPAFMDELVAALVATGATLAFDAVGGGRLAGQILTAMEAAATATAKEYSRYGSTTYKQVYIYGGLDRSPTELTRSFGMAWGLGGWLLTPFLQKAGSAATQDMRQRVAAEITTTFASTYSRDVSLVEALQLNAIAGYSRQATGEKYLITPNRP